MKIISIFFMIILLNNCTQIDQTISKRTTKASRLPAGDTSKVFGFRSSYIGSNVGTIRYSMLNEETFQKVNGPGWIIADGRCVSLNCCKGATSEEWRKRKKCDLLKKDSDYHFLMGGQDQAPDFRGKFLRAKNNGITSKDCPTRSPDCFDSDGERGVGSFQGDTYKKHRHSTYNNYTGPEATNHPNIYSFTIHRDNKMGTYTPTTEVGSKETRPKNIAVNVFIKINDN